MPHIPPLLHPSSPMHAVFADAKRLFDAHQRTVIELTILLALLPALVTAALTAGTHSVLISTWDGYLSAIVQRMTPSEKLVPLLSTTLYSLNRIGVLERLWGLARTILATPLLLAALALLYNGLMPVQGENPTLDAFHIVLARSKSLVTLAFLCTGLGWLVTALPSLISGILNAIAALFSYIPLLGNLLAILIFLVSATLTLLADWAVLLLVCYVWIAAACEGLPAMQAIVRSFRLLRANFGQTLWTLLSVELLYGGLLVVLFACIAWWGRLIGGNVTAFLWLAFALSAVKLTVQGTLSVALYMHRPAEGTIPPTGKRPLKRANLDRES